MSDQIIDIGRYLGTSPERDDEPAFAVWGGEGGRARYALPVWRAIFLTGGDWGGVVSLPGRSGDAPRPYFLLDLGQEPARMPRPSAVFGELEGEESPAIADSREGEIIVLLGKREKTRWFLHLLGKGLEVPLSVEKRGTLMFLAGECAGLLFAGVS